MAKYLVEFEARHRTFVEAASKLEAAELALHQIKKQNPNALISPTSVVVIPQPYEAPED
jgi:hypothetical protein